VQSEERIIVVHIQRKINVEIVIEKPTKKENEKKEKKLCVSTLLIEVVSFDMLFE